MLFISIRLHRCGLNRLQCAKMAERMEILFGGEQSWGRRNIVLDDGKILPTMNPLHVSRMAEDRDFKFCANIRGWGHPNQKYAKVCHRGSEVM